MNSVLTSIYDRNEMLWGKDGQEELLNKHVAVIGLGGVGSYTAEALARSGMGIITLVDFDVVSETNINRQLPALIPDIGKPKVELIKKRIELINPHIEVRALQDFSSSDLINKITDEKVDFIADAIDTLSSKIELIELCYRKKIPIITCFGAGNRIKPEELYLADISEINTKKCPFAKSVIYQLKKKGITKGLSAVASMESPLKVEKKLSKIEIKQPDGQIKEINKISPGSSPFVPSTAGLLMASYIVREIIKDYL